MEQNSPRIDAQDELAQERLKTMIAAHGGNPTINALFRQEIERGILRGRSPANLESRAQDLLDNGIAVDDLPSGMRELNDQPQGELAHALSEQNTAEVERILTHRGWDQNHQRKER